MRPSSLAVVAFLLAACAAGDSSTGSVVPPPPPPPVPGVVTSVVITGVNQMYVGLKTRFVATARDGAGTVVAGKSGIWATSAATVATVSSDGEVTGVSTGNAVISVTIDGLSAAAQVQVLNPPAVASLSLSILQDTTYLSGMVLPLGVIIRDADGNRLSRSVSLASSNPAAVTVTNGVRAVGPGTSLLTATVEGFTAQILLTIREGGVIASTGGQATGFGGTLTVIVPSNSLTASLPLAMQPTLVSVAPPGFVASTGFDLLPQSAHLDIPATIKVQYPASAVTGSVNPANFRLHQWDGTAWVPVAGSTVDVVNRVVTGASARIASVAVIEIQ